MLTLSLILPTMGRPTLAPLLLHLQKEIGPNDEVLVVGDGAQPEAQRAVAALKDPRFWYDEFGPTNVSGNAQRDHAIQRAKGDFLMFIDDDDDVIDGAINGIVRPNLERLPDRPHVFLWRGFPAEMFMSWRQTGGGMFFPPNNPAKLGTWDTANPGQDGPFIRETISFYPEGAVLHREEVYVYSKWPEDYARQNRLGLSVQFG